MRHLRAIVPIVLCCAAAFPGCGGSSSPTTPPATLAPPPVTSVVLEGSQADLQVNFLYTVGGFVAPERGRIDVTVDWSSAANNIDVYVAEGICNVEQFNQRQCSIPTFSQSTLLKPESLALAGLQPGNFTLLVGNRGPGVETATFRVVYTR